MSTEEKSHLSAYLGTDVTFMYVPLPPPGLGVVSADVSVSEIGGPLEASKLTISFLKGLLVALCIFKLNCKQRLIKE